MIDTALRLLSLVGEVGICQVVDPLMTIRIGLPWSVLNALGFPPRICKASEGVNNQEGLPQRASEPWQPFSIPELDADINTIVPVTGKDLKHAGKA